MKKTLKRVFALVLSVLMLGTDLTALLPKAEAASGFATAQSGFSGTKDDYTAQNNGRPNLYVSFLGDNVNYPVPGTTAVGVNNVPKPGTYDMEYAGKWTQYTNDQVVDGTIFWVGVGVDRVQLLKLLEDDGNGTSGLTSFEAGFYYDSNVVEPYTGTDFKTTIEYYNLSTGGSTNTWDSSQYKILRAETGLEVQTDEVTQEEMKKPAMEEITSGVYDTAQGGNTKGDWKMTYVSIELKDVESTARRLKGKYTGATKDTNGKVQVPNAAMDTDSGYEYLLMIPFKLKSFDGAKGRSHIRLIRNATHFSIGGEKYGVSPYGAWERVTERNLDHSLKLMTNFTGDLCLFTEGKAEEVTYQAQLKIINGGGAGNKAKLTVNEDPSIWTAYAIYDGDVIKNLTSGLNMMLEVEREAGYTVEVTVDFPDDNYPNDSTKRVWWDLTDRYTKVTDDQMYYTFNMPKFNTPPGPVIVTVTFRYDDREDFKLYLSEVQMDESGNQLDLTQRKVGNQTTITVNQVEGATSYDPPVDDSPNITQSINSFSPKAESHPNSTSTTGHSTLDHGLTPMVEAKRNKVVTVNVELHKDQQAVIKFYDFRAQTPHLTTGINKLSWQDIPSGSYSIDWSAGELTLREGGSFAFYMPETDLDIEIIYEPAPQHKATLEVWHDTAKSDINDYPSNTAQLVHTYYDDLNAPQHRYSGVVYEYYNAATTPITDNHQAVKNMGKALNWVSASEAALSGSLGGDSNASGVVWLPDAGPVNDGDIAKGQEAVMSVMAESADATALAGKLTALDVRDVSYSDGTTTYTGLRKDLQGTPFEDNDMTALAELLWEMRQRIENDSTLKVLYYKEAMKASATSTKAYAYYDLTAGQVQAYLLETFRAEEYQRENQRAYQLALQRYQTQLKWYNTWQAEGAYAGLAVPAAPAAPGSIEVGSAANNFVRSYQGKNYTDTYMTAYSAYMDAYEAYHAAVDAANGTGTGVTLSATAPGAPGMVDMTVMSVLDAQNDLASNPWSAPDVATMTSPTIQTREGRTVYVALEADSQYEVQSVTLYETDGMTPLYQTGTTLVLNASKETGYQNIYSFQMPEKDCVVRVTYQKRGTIDLNVKVEGHKKVTGNVTNVEAYSANPGSTTPLYNQVSNYHPATGTTAESWENDPYTVTVEKVLQGSVVTVTVNTHDDYKIASFTAIADGGVGVYYTSVVSSGNANQTVYTLTVPAGITKIDLTVKYELRDQKRNNAYIRTSGDLNSGLNNAFWHDGGGYYQVLADQPEGKTLEAYITVRPGYYIESITAHGASGTYSYTVTGNGYNGGHGAMDLSGTGGADSRVHLTTTMPDETYYVDVVFKKGVPPTDPQQTLTLTVKDEDNTDTANYAKNWAKAEIYDAALPDATDPANPGSANLEQNMPTTGVYLGDVLGKHADLGNGNLQDTKNVSMGKWVRLEFEAQVVTKADGTVDTDQSYYVSGVTISPSGLGATLVWESPTVVSFYMPEGTCGVTVTFEKYPASGLPTYKMQVRERVDGGTPTTMPSHSYVTTADSATIQGWNLGPLSLNANLNPELIPATGTAGATGAASAGETVTMTYTVDTSIYYVRLVQLLYPGGTRYLLSGATLVSTSGTVETYQVTFPMPAANAEFVVDYRTGTPPKEKEYELMLRLIDLENEERLDSNGTKVYDDNRAKATFTSTVSPAPADLEVGKELNNHAGDVVGYRDVHAGDTVTITARVASGYNLEYVVVTPYSLSIYPAIATPTSPDVYEGSFVMPAENVTVLVKVSKSPKREYTANLILRAPNGEDIDTVGQGSFVKYGEGAGGGNLGSIQDYYTNAIYSMIGNPGTKYGLDLYAFPGYYIDAITIDPVDPTGATVTYTGNVGYQTGEFTMPMADINVNVWFKKGWPDEIPYDMTLKVYDVTADGSGNPANYAYFDTVSGADAENPDVYVYGNESHTLEDKARDNDTVVVRVNKDTGYVYDVTVTDRGGNAVSWWYVPGGIAFTAPPSHVTVEVTFRQRPATQPTFSVTLKVENASGDSAAMRANGTTETVTSAAVSKTISGLDEGDAVDLTAITPASGRHVAAVYAYVTATGETVSIYELESGKTNSDCTTPVQALANGLPTAAGSTGQLAMPAGDVTIVVKFASGEVDTLKNPPVTLWVSGPSGSGNASLEIAEDGKQINNLWATGMDTVYSEKDNTVTVTFDPAKNASSGGSDYTIAKLEVYKPDGTAVDYEWISMVIDPAYLDSNGNLLSPDFWPVPPSDPTMKTPNYIPNSRQQITLKVPGEGVIVHVTYEKVDPVKQYKIQVVVNDEQFADTPPSLNDTWMNGTSTGTKSYIRYESAGNWVELNVTVHPGYHIETFIAVPQGYGISPSLPLGNGYDQTTGLRMLAGDIVVYVKYVRDDTARKNATLVVTDYTYNSMAGKQETNLNYATITSPISSTSPPVTINATPESVLARPGTDWVTVEYYWNPQTTSIYSITVQNVAGTVNVPFTQGVNEILASNKGHGSIRLPMYSEDIVITVTYRPSSQPLPQTVNLHVIDETTGKVIEDNLLAGWGRLNYTPTAGWTTASAQDTNQVAAKAVSTAYPDGNTATIQVPAGETVDLSAFAGTVSGMQVYVKSAVVIYQQTGQVIHCNLHDASGNAATTGNLSDKFTVHPGVNDVYIRLTTTKVEKDEHSVVLMLRGPENDSGVATIKNTTQNTAPDPNVVDGKLTQANVGYTYTVGQSGDNIDIQVIPAPGYEIDYIQITPLGFPLDTATYDWVRSGNSISFKMPHINVGVLVVLKRGVSAEYTATLHYIQDTATVDPTDQARLYWTPSGASTPSEVYADADSTTPWNPVEKLTVKEGAEVTLEGYLNGADDVILSAYVLRDGTLVPLTPSWPASATASTGLEGVTNNRPTEADGIASFTMPAEDVDVYLVVTDDPPTQPWHTVVVVATDQKGNVVNSGLNQGQLWETNDAAGVRTAVSTGHAGHVSLALTETRTVGSSVVPNTFSVKPIAAAGYEFQLPATATYNTAPYSANLNPKGLNPYLYEEQVGDRNTAVKLHFVAAEKLTLTVEIEDRENPGDGSVVNAVDVKPAGGTPGDLHLESTDAFGAYQIMNDVTGGQVMSLKVTPRAGYKAYAKLTDTFGVVSTVELTQNADGSYSGSFNMPSSNATLTVVFTTGYTGTLEIVNNTASGHQASMRDTVRHSDATPYRVNVVTAVSPIKQLTDLPNGDTLVARMETTAGEDSYDLTALLTVKGSTSFMTAVTDGHETVEHYDHTIDRADGKITFILNEPNTDPAQKDYVAAVTTVNAPDSTVNLTDIENTTNSTALNGDVWTVAKSGNGVKATIELPDGYEATVTATQTDGTTIAGWTDMTLTTAGTHTASITMPEGNVLVTVTYKKVKFDLTLVIIDHTGKSNAVLVSGGAVNLVNSGDTTTAKKNDLIAVTITPDSAVSYTASYRGDDGTAGTLTGGGSFLMPEADTTVYVRFRSPATPGKTERNYIAFTAARGTDGLSDNRVTSIANLTDSTADTVSPDWTAIGSEDQVKVTFQTAAGYYATVEATYLYNSTTLPVSQIGATGNGYATVKVPSGLSGNVKITVVYSTQAPNITENDAALRLVGHDAALGNAATLSAAQLNTISLNGQSGTAYLVNSGDAKSDLEKQDEEVFTGDDLRTWAAWDSGYQVIRVTLALRTGGDKVSPVETPEIDLPMAEYSGTVTARCDVPLLTSAGYIPVIRVYYGNIYEATLHVVRNGTTGDTTHATDDRGGTQTSTGSDPIYNTGDKLIALGGGESIETTAIADTANGQRLVGVVWESDKLGANSATVSATVTGQYDFTMPQEDVDFYAVYETEPADPADRSYIAKVAFQGDVHTQDSANQVTIRNESDTTAASGRYWTAAKGGDKVTVTVKVAAGYQAEIISTKIDDSTKIPAGVNPGDDYHYYISRSIFVPNLPDGKDASFSMPLESDATVTVKYTRGYDLELNITDVSGLASSASPNSARVENDATGNTLVQGKNDGIPNNPTYDPQYARGLASGLTLKTGLVHADGNVASRVLYSSPLTGTVTLKGNSTATAVSDYTMPSANVVESVLFRDDTKEDKLLAKVQLKGESDITGNHVECIVDTDSPDTISTTTGSIWTTTKGGQTIDMTLTVAKGYVAKIKVLRDDSISTTDPTDTTVWKYLDAQDYDFAYTYTTATGTGGRDPMVSAGGIYEVEIGYVDDATEGISGVTFAGNSSGKQHFRFTMPNKPSVTGDSDTDVTVIVEFVYAGEMPRPYDPGHTDDADDGAGGTVDKLPEFLEEGFIYGENRGDYAIVDIPALMDSDKLYDTDNWDETPSMAQTPVGSGKDADKAVTFKFYLRKRDTAGQDSYILLTDDDVELLLDDPDDPDWTAGEAYNYYESDYLQTADAANTTAHTRGAKFRLVPKETATGGYTTNGQIYYDMLNDLENADSGDDLLGSLEALNGSGSAKDEYKARLYVAAEDTGGRQSTYTEVWIRPAVKLAGEVASYGPKHPIIAELYRYDTASTGDKMDFSGYETEVYLTDEVVLEGEASNYTSQWVMTVAFRSSELLGGWDGNYDPNPATTRSYYLLKNVVGTAPTYAFKLKKAGNITYTRVNLDLDVSGFNLAGNVIPGYYTESTMTFLLQDQVMLFAGATRGLDVVRNSDLELLEDYLTRHQRYTTYATEADAIAAGDQDGWNISILNPDSEVYACDLDSNGQIGENDYSILKNRYNWLRTAKSYLWTQVSSGSKVLPFGFGSARLNGDYTALFAVKDAGEAYPLAADLYWSGENTTNREAELPGVYVEADGTVLNENQVNAWKAQQKGEGISSTGGKGENTSTTPNDALKDLFGGEESERPSGGEAMWQPGGWEPVLPPEEEADGEPEAEDASDSTGDSAKEDHSDNGETDDAASPGGSDGVETPEERETPAQ